MGANIAIANAMGTTAKTMSNMNKVMNPHQIAKDMDAFKNASAKMDMTDEMSKYPICWSLFLSAPVKS